jgi:hypothetical protein
LWVSDSPSEFFRSRGFELTFGTHTEEEIAAIYAQANDGVKRKVRMSGDRALAERRTGRVFTDLRAPNGRLLMADGTGADEALAAKGAVERWRQEQGE